MNTDYLNMFISWTSIHPLFVALAVIWIITWKGMALWRSAELRQKHWFIILLLVNTLGVLEIIYIFLVARKYEVEIIEENG